MRTPRVSPDGCRQQACGVLKFRGPGITAKCVVEELSEAVTRDNELPRASEVSDGSADSLEPDRGGGCVAEDAGPKPKVIPRQFSGILPCSVPYE